MSRLRKFFRSVLPAELAQLIPLCGLVCLIVGTHLRCLPTATVAGLLCGPGVCVWLADTTQWVGAAVGRLSDGFQYPGLNSPLAPQFAGKSVVILRLWTVLAYILFRHWPIQIGEAAGRMAGAAILDRPQLEPE